LRATAFLASIDNGMGIAFEKLDQLSKRVMDITDRDLGAEQWELWGDGIQRNMLRWWI
jgi:hypothetical protein